MPGKHKPGYRAPRTGQKRQTRQPFAIDRMPEEVRTEILKRKNSLGETWQEISDASPSFAGKVLAVSTLQRWYDVRFEQVQAEVAAQSERARVIAAAFAGKGFEKLPEAVQSGLSAAIFSLAESSSADDRAKFLKAMNEFAWLLARNRQLDQEDKRLRLENEKLEQLKSKADKATNEAATKLEGGKQVTLKDINRIRERTFGLPPIQRSAAAGNPA